MVTTFRFSKDSTTTADTPALILSTIGASTGINSSASTVTHIENSENTKEAIIISGEEHLASTSPPPNSNSPETARETNLSSTAHIVPTENSFEEWLTIGGEDSGSASTPVPNEGLLVICGEDSANTSPPTELLITSPGTVNDTTEEMSVDLETPQLSLLPKP